MGTLEREVVNRNVRVTCLWAVRVPRAVGRGSRENGVVGTRWDKLEEML